jgi:BlaI family transcriptional regulator, penicillinase repressor
MLRLRQLVRHSGVEGKGKAMARKSRDVTEAELGVLQVLWNHGPRTIREVAAILDARNQDVYYATVKKLLERLDAKEFVRREPKGIAYLYAATVGRDEFVGERLRALSERLCDGSVTPLLTQLAQHERLNKKQQAALLALIDELAADEDKVIKPRGRRK